MEVELAARGSRGSEHGGGDGGTVRVVAARVVGMAAAKEVAAKEGW